jgi:hypothetical protein
MTPPKLKFKEKICVFILLLLFYAVCGGFSGYFPGQTRCGYYYVTGALLALWGGGREVRQTFSRMSFRSIFIVTGGIGMLAGFLLMLDLRNFYLNHHTSPKILPDLTNSIPAGQWMQ